MHTGISKVIVSGAASYGNKKTYTDVMLEEYVAKLSSTKVPISAPTSQQPVTRAKVSED